VSAVAAGLLADRLSGRRVILGLFATAVVGYAALWRLGAAPIPATLVFTNLIVTYVAVFGLRGVYFAMLEETRVPSARTGTAVGLISVVGYTPDFLFAPIAGRLLDHSPGLLGHQHVFLLLGCVAAVGVLAVIGLGWSRQPSLLETID
jgi:nitrate/nitrite transporter NarK